MPIMAPKTDRMNMTRATDAAIMANVMNAMTWNKITQLIVKDITQLTV